MSHANPAFRSYYRPKLTLAGVLCTTLASLAVSRDVVAQSGPWGLRRMDGGCVLGTWPTTSSSGPSIASTFAGHEARFLNFFLLTDKLASGPTPEAGEEFDWQHLEDKLDQASALSAIPVIGLKLKGAGWLTGATQTTPTKPPTLMDTSSVPAWPTGQAKGYDEAMYDFAIELANTIKTYYSASGSTEVYINFFPEQWREWPIWDRGYYLGNRQALSSEVNQGIPPQTTSVHFQSLNAYILTYLTIRQAFEAVESAAPAGTIDFKFSHGSIPRHRLLMKDWLSQGQADPTKRDSLLENARSLVERIPRVIENLGAGGSTASSHISTWDDMRRYVGLDTSEGSPTTTAALEQNFRNDLWLHYLVQWTQSSFFDFNTQHHHGKAIWETLERRVFSHLSTSSLPWVLTECTIETIDIANDSRWPLAPSGGFDREAWLVANGVDTIEDAFVRKWCTILADTKDGCTDDFVSFPISMVQDSVEAFCVPIVGGNNDPPLQYPTSGPESNLTFNTRDYWGLYQRCGPFAMPECENSKIIGHTPPPPAFPNCRASAIHGGQQSIDANRWNGSYTELSDLLGSVLSTQDKSTCGSTPVVHFRFTTPEGPIDVLWKQELFDASSATTSYLIAPPQGEYSGGTVLEARGGLVPRGGFIVSPDGIHIADLSQAPVFVIWS